MNLMYDAGVVLHSAPRRLSRLFEFLSRLMFASAAAAQVRTEPKSGSCVERSEDVLAGHSQNSSIDDGVLS